MSTISLVGTVTVTTFLLFLGRLFLGCGCRLRWKTSDENHYCADQKFFDLWIHSHDNSFLFDMFRMLQGELRPKGTLSSVSGYIDGAYTSPVLVE